MKGNDINLPALNQLPALEPLYPGRLQDRQLPMPTLDARRPIYNPPRRATMKLPKYHGETYFVQVQLAADFNGWSSKETGVQVALALEGKALQALMDLTPGQHASDQRRFAALFRTARVHGRCTGEAGQPLQNRKVCTYTTHITREYNTHIFIQLRLTVAV